MALESKAGIMGNKASVADPERCLTDFIFILKEKSREYAIKTFSYTMFIRWQQMGK